MMIHATSTERRGWAATPGIASSMPIVVVGILPISGFATDQFFRPSVASIRRSRFRPSLAEPPIAFENSGGGANYMRAASRENNVHHNRLLHDKASQ